jgi:hypothetical protein
MKRKLGNAAGAVGQWAVAASAAAVVAGLVGTGLATPGYAFDPSDPIKNTCTIVHNRDVATVIGKVIQPANQIGPQPDQTVPGATTTSCQFEGANGGLTVNVQQFGTPDGASGEINQMISDFQNSNQPGVNTVVSQESGLGQSTYWVVSKVQTNVDDPNSIVPKGTFIVLTSNRVITVGTDWSDAAPDDLKPALFKLTKEVIDRVS